MGHSTIESKAEGNRNTARKTKGNRAGEIPPSIRRPSRGAALLQEFEERGNLTDDLVLEYYCLFKIASTLSGQMDVDHTLTIVKKLIRQKFPVDQYSLMLVDESGRYLVIRSHFGLPRKEAQQPRYALDENILGGTLKRRHLVYVSNVQDASLHDRHYPGSRPKQGAFLWLPLLTENGRTVGVMNLFRREPDSFSAKEIDLLRKIAGQIGRVVDTIAIYQQARALSITDELTGIFNRRYFNQRYEREIQRAQRYGRSLSLVMLDIDHFKAFNDTHGHVLGDTILKRVAQILDESIRKADILARFGGEEFVVVLPEIDKEHGRKAAEKLRHTIECSHFPKAETQPFGRLTISLGLASFPQDARDAGELITCADQGLYLAKARGRNQVGVYEEETGKISPAQNEMQQQI